MLVMARGASVVFEPINVATAANEFSHDCTLST